MRLFYHCVIIYVLLTSHVALAANYNLNAPSTSSGSYTVTWSNPNGSVYTLQERRNNGEWVDSLTSTSVTYKTLNKAVSGTYDYRIMHAVPCYHYCPNGNYFIYYSAIDSTNVTVLNGVKPRYPSNIQGPSNDNDGVFPITWVTPNDIVDSYDVQQRVNNGAWYYVGSTDKTVMWMTDRGNGSYKYRVRSCNSNGCGSYSTYFYGQVYVSHNTSASVNITYKYDELGRLISVADAKSGYSQFTYDDAGNRVEVTTNSDTGNQD